MSETVMLTSNPRRATASAGTVGRALPGVQVRVVDDGAGARRDRQRAGARSECVLGLLAHAGKDAREFTADGWFKTGDVGRWGGESAGATCRPITCPSSDAART